jgi:hypothetical protein
MTLSLRKKVQLIAIAFLVIAVVLFIPTTEWSKQNSVLGFISLILGTTGSIISIFIPNSYTFHFDSNTWNYSNSNKYSITVSYKKHGLGKSPKVQTFELDNGIYDEVMVSSGHDLDGSVTIGANKSFDGKIVIT